MGISICTNENPRWRQGPCVWTWFVRGRASFGAEINVAPLQIVLVQPQRWCARPNRWEKHDDQRYARGFGGVYWRSRTSLEHVRRRKNEAGTENYMIRNDSTWAWHPCEHGVQGCSCAVGDHRWWKPALVLQRLPAPQWLKKRTWRQLKALLHFDVYVTALTEWLRPSRCIRRFSRGGDRQLPFWCAACAEDEVTSVVIATLCFTPWHAGSGRLSPIEWMVGD